MAAPSLTDEKREQLIALLAAGTREGSIQRFWALVYRKRLASSTIAHWRKKAKPLIDERRKARIDEALNSGLALKTERIAALKEHAEQLAAIKFAVAKNGKLWNEKAWRETLADIAIEMGDRKPKDAPQEQTIKVYVGVDPDKV